MAQSALPSVRGRRRPKPSPWGVAIASLAGAVLLGALVTSAGPASAAIRPAAPTLGGFAIGDGLEATISESDGALALVLPLGGLGLGWDSRQAGVDRHGLGGGWAWHSAWVDVSGGVRVFPASGGVYAADASQASGLAGYPGGDVRFEAAAGVLPARADAVTGARDYAYRLHELGGRTTWFDDDGDAVAVAEATGARTDLVWDEDVPHRLREVVTGDGLVTGLEWSPETLTVRPGRGLASPAAGDGSGGAWHVSLAGDRIAETVDPVGTRTSVRYTPEALLEAIGSATGATTRVEWRPRDDDQVPRVDRVRVVSDTTDAELSMRRWMPGAGAPPSGWPVVDPAEASGAARPAHETVLSDGATSVVSAYDDRGRLERRAVRGTGGAGSVELQTQRFAYPADAGLEALGDSSVAWSRPTSATITYADASGASRTTTASFGYDAQGRVVVESRPDGTRAETRYDDTAAGGAVLPVGLPVLERTIGADGLVAETRHTLTADRSAVAATETWTGRVEEPLMLAGRTEYTVGTNGFVTEQRELAVGGDSAAAPVTTRWNRTVNVDAGTQTITQTVAAGTAAEASTTRVASLVHGGVLRETDTVGRTVSAAYDGAGRVIEQTDAVGSVTETSYANAQHDGRNAVTVTGPDRVSVTEVRDELGRVVELHDNIDGGRPVDGHVRVSERRAYPAPGIVAVTDAWGATTTTTHDAFGRLISKEQPTGLVEVAHRDDVEGAATVGLSPTGDLGDAEHTTTQFLDDAGRPVETSGTRADGVAVPGAARRYDGLGRTVWASDGVRAETVTYDGLGSPATTTISSATSDEPAALTSQRRCDGFGRSVEKTLGAGGGQRSGGSREFDPLGRVVVETDQAGGVTRTAYTADGLVARVDHASGAIEERTYDARTRALTGSRTTSPTGSTIGAAIEVDARTGETKAIYDPVDRTGTELRWTTDAFGNTTSLRYPDGAEIRHEYDQHGRRRATVDTAGNRTEYAYDRAGRPIGAEQRTAAGVELSRVAYEYDRLGRMHRLTRGNGVTTDYTFTSVGEIARETTTLDGEVLSDRSYDYSPSGLVLSRVDRTRGDQGALRATTTAYTYDLLDRLTRSSVYDGETTDASEVRRTEYELTVSGDIARETETERPGADDPTTSRREFEYSTLGELIAITTDGTRSEQQFDAAGSLVRAADGTRYEYDAANRLIAATAPDGEVTRTAYWADGRRRSQTSADGTTAFYWDGETLVSDTHIDPIGASVGTAGYLLGAERHARSTIESGSGAVATAYATLDRHGNVTEQTDEAGAVEARYTYSDYGVATETRGAGHDVPAPGGLHRNPFRYASEYTDRDGRQHLQTRLYDAQQMRFDRRDRAELHNLYAYADLNPISKVDPTGRTAWLDWMNVAATGLGAALSVAGGVSAISTLLTMVAGPASLGVFGIAAVTVGLADAAFAGFQVANTLSTIKWMDETAATAASWVILGVGIGTAAAGIVSRRLLDAGKGAKRLFGPAPDGIDDDVIESSIERLKQHQLARGRAIGNVPHIEARLVALTKLSNQVVTLEETLKLTPALSKPTRKIGKITGALTAATAEMTKVLRINASMRARPMSPGESSDLFITPGTRARSNAAQNQALAHLTSAEDRLQRLRTDLIVDHGIKPRELEDLEIELGKIISDVGKYLQKF